MSHSDDLFLLVKSLSKSEKRFITLSSEFQKGEKDYMKLYNYLNKKDSYDETKLRKQLNLTPRQLTLAKGYLSEHILSALRNYHPKIQKARELNEQIHSANILLSRGLLNHALKICKKVKQESISLEFYPQTLDIVQVENIILVQKNRFDLIEQNTKLIEEVFTNLKEIRDLLGIYYVSLMLQNSRFYSRTEENKQRIQELINHPLLSTENSQHSLSGRLFFHIIHDLMAKLENDVNKSYHHTSSLLQIMDENPEYKIARPNYYISAVIGTLSSSFHLEKYDRCLAVAESIQSFKSSKIPAEIQAEGFLGGHLYRMECHLVLGNKDQLETTLNNLIDTLGDYITLVSSANQLVGFYRIAYNSYLLGFNETALKYLNRLLNQATKTARTDIQAYAHLLRLIINFEEGNYDFLDYYIRSTYRFLITREHLFDVEKVILKSMRKLPNVNDHEQFKSFCASLKKELEPLEKDPDQKQGFFYFDFLSWLESKLTNKEMIDIINQRSKGSSH